MTACLHFFDHGARLDAQGARLSVDSVLVVSDAVTACFLVVMSTFGGALF